MKFSREENERILADLKECHSTENVNRLVEHNIPLVKHLIGQYRNCCSDYEDLFQMGCVGLVKAARAFDASKDVQFATFAAWCIKTEILTYFRHEKKVAREAKLDDIACMDKEGKPKTLGDLLAADINIEEDYIENELAKHALCFVYKINGRDGEILRRYYGIGCKATNQLILAQEYGTSQTQISRIIRKQVANIRRRVL